MAAVDLSHYAFDYDLTFAIVMLSPDGRILHRYGGRDHRSAHRYLSMPSLLRVMDQTLSEVAAKAGSIAPPRPSPPRKTIRDVGAYRDKIRGKDPSCVHCHEVFPALHRQARRDGGFQPADIWVYPSPRRVGIDMDPARQDRIAEVVANSAAAMAGLRVGDRLIRLGGTAIASYSDVQFVLDALPHGATRLSITIERNVDAKLERRRSELILADGWKRATPLEFSWRPSKWDLDPAPGFGGKMLNGVQRRELGLENEAMTFRIGYVVTWGPRAYTGRNVERAGLRKGDIVLSIAGRRDFANWQHFHAWYRLTQHVGGHVTIDAYRPREKRRFTLELPVVGPDQRKADSPGAGGGD